MTEPEDKALKWAARLMQLQFWLILAPVVVGVLCCGGYAIWLGLR